MSTSKHIDKICCIVLAVTLVITFLFINSEKTVVRKSSTVMGYESKLFDISTVHSIDIIMDDWDEFTANCKSEEYYNCTVVIDNDAYKNVAIRGKGNTSLTQVESYGNNRYSFKIEFDHYDNSKSYYGLDKLCLNNIIQDNTYMKDFICYQMMNDMGVAAPLCSYVYITVNGEDWGLYLAVEGVEESFLQRNYGNSYGELYKPDSQSMGAGRGNGEGFDLENFINNGTQSTLTDNNGSDTALPIDSEEKPEVPQAPDDRNADKGTDDKFNGFNGNGAITGEQPNMPASDNMTPPNMDGENANMPNFNFGFDGKDKPNEPTTEAEDSENIQEKKENSDNESNHFNSEKQEFAKGMTNGSDDVLLKYIDDDFDSYSNIFNNAKTSVSSNDKKRLINALKTLSSGENIESCVDIEAVIRYFVAHNFVLNFDSYTGSMIHNYYLYEKDGLLQMIPWDYNLSFGGFESAGNATSLVNYPIDSPVSGGNTEDRPMLAWIFENEEYTQLYHKFFNEFINDYFDSGYFEKLIGSTTELISPYVEKDPTKFCTYEEFETGVSTLTKFCLLRAESIRSQLNGTIGSTSDTQENSTLIDASELQISDMGSMNNSMNMSRPSDNKNQPDAASNSENSESADAPDTEISQGFGEVDIPQPPSSAENSNAEDAVTEDAVSEKSPPDLKEDKNGNPDNLQRMDKNISGEEQGGAYLKTLTLTASCFLILTVGLIFAFAYKRRK